MLSAVPTVQLTAPPSPFIGQDVALSATFSNTSPTDAGYGPYIDVILPATGTDGNDGITFNSGSASTSALP